MTECFAFAIGGLPNPILHPKQADAMSKFLKGLDGFIGMHLYDRYHTFLVFDTLNHAKVARNRFTATGNRAGNHIMAATISDDQQTLTIGEPAT